MKSIPGKKPLLLVFGLAFAGCFAGMVARASGSDDADDFWADDPVFETGSENETTPYDPILDRLRSFETNAVKTADGDYLLSFVGQFDNFTLDQRLKTTAAGIYALNGQFAKYRNVRDAIRQLSAFEKAVLDPCPTCAGSGEQANPDGNKSRCRKCRGAGWRLKDRASAKEKLDGMTKLAIAEADRCRLRHIREIKNAAQREEARRKAAEQKEEARRRAEEFAKKQRARGLVLHDGKWMTPTERDHVRRLDRFRSFVADRSIVACRFRILQIIGNGRALCVNDRTGNTFCLLYATDSAHNRAIAEGDRFTNDLFWCGTYSYTTVQNAPARVALYAIDVERALVEAVRQGFYED